MVPMMTLSDKRLGMELKRLVGVVADPFSPIRNPEAHQQAVKELRALLSHPDHWNAVNVEPHERKSLLSRQLGIKRIRWLKTFYQNEVLNREN